ncbi:nectin 1a-like isoform X1 [Garra rufa]|uniref:nectin 1a-like isoform X1 n=1 Tax=Garra rufa TaxID=137080 RepID=UPI003CCE723D
MMDLNSVFFPLLLSCTSVFTVLHGQKVVTESKVTWYQGQDVTLICQYEGDTEDKITQVQWTWQNESSKYEIVVFNVEHGLSLHETFLKDRVSFSKISIPINDTSIIIKDVKKSDQGVYSCDYTIYPSGSHTGKTTLTVLEGSPPVLSTVDVVGIVTAVVLIPVIIAAVGYLFLCNRRQARSTILYYTTQSPSDLQQDVTYSDVTIRKPVKANRSTSSSGEIEYAAVSFSGRSKSASLQAKQLALDFHTGEQETVYAQVKKD